MIALLGLSLLAVAQGTTGSCPLIPPVARNAAAARRIAETVIRNVNARRARRAIGRTRFILLVEPDRDDARRWVAVQMLPPPPRPHRPGEIIVQAGGGGLGFRIDRCTGAIRQMY